MEEADGGVVDSTYGGFEKPWPAFAARSSKLPSLVGPSGAAKELFNPRWEGMYVGSPKVLKQNKRQKNAIYLVNHVFLVDQLFLADITAPTTHHVIIKAMPGYGTAASQSATRFSGGVLAPSFGPAPAAPISLVSFLCVDSAPGKRLLSTCQMRAFGFDQENPSLSYAEWPRLRG